MLGLITVLGAPRPTWSQDFKAEWEAMREACIRSGGYAPGTYEAWIAQNGCKCNGVSSGQRTCPSGSSITPGDSPGTVIGKAVVDIEKQAFNQLLYGNAEEKARREQEAALLAERRRIAAEKERQRLEEMKQRVLGLLKGTEGPSSPLGLKMGDTNTPLVVGETRDAFGSKIVMPTAPGTPGNPLGLKLGDDPDPSGINSKQADTAGQGFDTAGKILGSGLPPAPPAPLPSSAPTLSAEKLTAMHDLLAKLRQNNLETHALKGQLTQLQQASTPDAPAIEQVQEKLKAKEEEKNKVMVDLTALDPGDADDTAQQQSNAAAPASEVAAPVKPQ